MLSRASETPSSEWDPLGSLLLPDPQSVPYGHGCSLHAAVSALAQKGPLVSPEDILSLNHTLLLKAGFIIQAGYCAEPFEPSPCDQVSDLLSALSEMAESMRRFVPGVLLMGRLAGQFAKPRSALREPDGHTLTFRGDIINGHPIHDRNPCPLRLLKAYEQSRSILGVSSIWTCHECLCLPYEAPLARHTSGGWVATSAHFLWLGDRTCRLDGAHLSFLSHVRNPVGIKVGPTRSPRELLAVLDAFGTTAAAAGSGRFVSLITRFGSALVTSCLPPILETVLASGANVHWICDPMHGNTRTIGDGRHSVKTRFYSEILEEVAQTIVCLRIHGIRLDGIHLEVSGSPLTMEVVGGTSAPVSLEQVKARTGYTTLCDPRLNRLQALDLIADLGRLLTEGL